MHRLNWLRAVSILTGFAMAMAAQDAAPAVQDVLPGQTVQVATHHSRWEYPKEIAIPEGCQVHVVETGNTLWDLGTKYLENPFSWPQIWELNKWVTDPHWIYPGDYLLIPSNRKAIGINEAGPEVPPGSPKASRVSEEYAFTFQDFIQLPYLVEKGAESHFKDLGALKIKSHKYEGRSHMGDADEIYLDAGVEKGVKVGDRLLALKVIRKAVYHPDDPRNSKNLGDIVKQVGVVRVTQADQNSAVAVIEKSMDTIEDGDRLVPFPDPANIPLKLRTDTKEPIAVKPPAAKVLWAGDSRTISGNGDMIILDKGANDGMNVGEVLLSVRDRNWIAGASASSAHPKGSTNYLLAQLLVVKTSEHSATCRILRAVEDVLIGDVVTH